ncbi:hypothetical protein M3661_15360 [Paenibacillus sp. MER 180]|uniref:hypothetical protein n=1 Tax=Paenibacillus sp. MER 180 TaxID=2939570 RepID=UPI00203D83C9|nr:hypothetical protein [Paenibacillus sp. MER 180]MCM3291508.1 hypothetical protein [Paenibacillus sp. MER 180]
MNQLKDAGSLIHSGNSTRYPFVAQDRVNSLFGHQIHCVLRLVGFVDMELLVQAYRVTLDIEPVLGCRLAEENQEWFWERRADLDMLNGVSIHETDDVETQLKAFICAPSDARVDPLISIRVFRSTYDLICVKCNHACCDAGGVKDYISLLSSTYNHLSSSPNSPPTVPNKGRRDQGIVFDQLGYHNLLEAWDASEAQPIAKWAFPFDPSTEQKLWTSAYRFQPECYRSFQTFNRLHGVSFNDLLLTAYYRALFSITRSYGAGSMPLPVTMDLRQHLPNGKAKAICNLSSSMNIEIEVLEHEPFLDTLMKVNRQTKKAKNPRLGVNGMVTLETLAALNYEELKKTFHMSMEEGIKSKKSNPILSNVGIISDQPIFFSDVEVIDAYIAGPIMMPPGFLLLISSYNQNLTLSTGYDASSVKEEHVELLLRTMASELILAVS